VAGLAQVNPWERLSLIEEGKRVAVKLHSGKTVNGRIRKWSPGGLVVLQGENRPVQLAKSDIAQVALVAGRSRAEKARFWSLRRSVGALEALRTPRRSGARKIPKLWREQSFSPFQ